MKRIFCIIAAVVLAFSMTACMSTDDDSGSSSSSSADEESSAPDSSESDSEEEPSDSSDTESSNMSLKTGLGNVVSLENSRGATTDSPAAAQADVTMCAASFDKDGTIVSITFDVAQCKVDYNAEGGLTTDISAPIKTKREMGDDYNMKPASAIGKEWYEQVDALQEWMIGKTVDEVSGMKVKAVEDRGDNVPDEPDLTSSVTIDVGIFLAAMQSAYENAA